MTNIKNREGWNNISRKYQENNQISVEEVHYGPSAPGENELQLLGNVQGLSILELGCGGGQNSISLAKQGATQVIGVDLSEVQLEHARKLAESEGVSVRFLQGNMEVLDFLESNSFDLVISSHAIGYVEDLNAVIAETARVLRPTGFLVFCVGHPIRNVVGDALEEGKLELLRNYFDKEREKWDWDYDDGTHGTFESANWKLSDLINGIIDHGLQIERIEEPQAYDVLNMTSQEIKEIPYHWWKDCDPSKDNYVNKFLNMARKIPYSLIIKARKLQT